METSLASVLRWRLYVEQKGTHLVRRQPCLGRPAALVGKLVIESVQEVGEGRRDRLRLLEDHDQIGTLGRTR